MDYFVSVYQIVYYSKITKYLVFFVFCFFKSHRLTCRMFENKMKELEKELSQKTSSVSELKQQLKEAKEHEERAQTRVRQLEDQVRIFTLVLGIGCVVVSSSECI